MSKTQICRVCEEKLPYTDFTKNARNTKTGLEKTCRICLNNKKDNAEHKQYKATANAKFKALNPTYSSKWQSNNKDKITDNRNRRNADNPEKYEEIKEKQKLYRRERRKDAEVKKREQLRRQENALKYKISAMISLDKKHGYKIENNEIDEQYIQEIVKQQNGLNKYTNTPIRWYVQQDTDNNAGDHFSSSIDRIDSTKGHICGNVQIVELWINRMKLHFDEITWAKFLSDIASSKQIADCNNLLFYGFPKEYLDRVHYFNNTEFKSAKDFPKQPSDLDEIVLKKNIRKTFDNIFNNSKNRQINKYNQPLSFTREKLYELMHLQNYTCAITGLPCCLLSNNPYKFSLDRIDSDLPYSCQIYPSDKFE